MPRGEPRIGSGFGQILGTIKDGILGADAPADGAQWEGPSGRVSVEDGPPPWETEDGTYSLSDARRFVTVPDHLEVRWINPKVLDAEGWRDWQPVLASDERFEVRVATMVSPEGNIRRGGPTGDILAFMPKSWVYARRKLFAQQTQAQTERANAHQESLKEDFKRGKYGPYTHLEEKAAQPGNTTLDGRALRQQD